MKILQALSLIAILGLSTTLFCLREVVKDRESTEQTPRTPDPKDS